MPLPVWHRFFDHGCCAAGGACAADRMCRSGTPPSPWGLGPAADASWPPRGGLPLMLCIPMLCTDLCCCRYKKTDGPVNPVPNPVPEPEQPAAAVEVEPQDMWWPQVGIPEPLSPGEAAAPKSAAPRCSLKRWREPHGLAGWLAGGWHCNQPDSAHLRCRELPALLLRCWASACVKPPAIGVPHLRCRRRLCVCRRRGSRDPGAAAGE